MFSTPETSVNVLDKNCEIGPLERERGRLRGKGSGEHVSFKTRMEDPVRHANQRFRSRVRAWNDLCVEFDGTCLICCWVFMQLNKQTNKQTQTPSLHWPCDQGRIQWGGGPCPPVVSVCNIFCPWLLALRHTKQLTSKRFVNRIAECVGITPPLPNPNLGSATLQLQL